MGKKREEEISFLLHKEITTMICILMSWIPYQYNLLSLFHFVLPISALISSFFWGAGAKYVQTAAFRRRKTRSPGKRVSPSLAKKKQLMNLIGPYTEISGYGKEKMFVSTTEIGKGSNGTVIFEGMYQGRKVAVKRLSKAHHTVALKEVQHLIASDQHPNIVRWHGVKRDKNYVYLALERSICSLSDLISLHADPPQNSDSFVRQIGGAPWSTTVQNINLWKNNGYPSALLLKLLRDMVYGLAHLHKLGIHQDIKPQNVMIAEGNDICAKLSDIGISKCSHSDKLSSSPNAAGSGDSGRGLLEKKFDKRQRWAADMYSLGCVFFFCLTRGRHSFDHQLEHDNNIKKKRVNLHLLDHMPEAVDLLSRLLHSVPKKSPTAFQVLHHPLFWTSDMRLSFVRDVSDRLKLESTKNRRRPSNILITLEKVAHRAFGTSWAKKIEPALIQDISCNRGKQYKYKYNNVQHLLRVMRNKLNHYYESPRTIQELLGPVPEGIDDYFSSRFPWLLMEVYKVVINNCRSEKYFEKYFGVDSAPVV